MSKTQPAYLYLDANNNEVDETSDDCIVIVDTANKLEWGAQPLLKGKEVPHKKALKAAKDCRLLGGENWQLMSIQEQRTVEDLTRHAPAVKAPFARRWPKSGWAWTRSDAASPVYSGYAWGVFLLHGGSFVNYRYGGGCVLVCRPASPRQ